MSLLDALFPPHHRHLPGRRWWMTGLRTVHLVGIGDAEDVVNLLRTQMKLDTLKRRFPRTDAVRHLLQVRQHDVHHQAYPEGGVPDFEDHLEEIMSLHTAYTRYKTQHNLMDYDDLLLHLRTLLRDHEQVRRALSDRYRYIMVDEYQDTNRMQADIVRLLADRHRNVMVVGDDSQAIYSFRGATIRNILDFPEEFPGCTIITLEENYRSTQPILNLTNEILRRARE